jgi:hypothetical protein
VAEVVYIDDEGRFQMAAEDLGDFIQYLQNNKVRVEAEASDAFHSGGKAYGYGRLLHLFDADLVGSLYRSWKAARGSGAVGERA